ncbi:MAG: repeat-containing protein [Planctomycetaceae bacterium]|nr:repeat-containing protein [Planctomycetaceae bacterium]
MVDSHEESSGRENELDVIYDRYLKEIESGHSVDQLEFLLRFPDYAVELAKIFARDNRIEGLLHPRRPKNSDPEPREVPSDVQGNTDEPQSAEPTDERGQEHWMGHCQTCGRFGDYEIQGRLGEGGMGVVYRARHISLNRPVALKMMREREDPRRFQLEAEALASLKHPHIIPIHEIGEVDGYYFFSMDLIEGNNLDKRLKSNEYSSDPLAVAMVMFQIAQATAHAHHCGILHRDLKPSNILIDCQGVAVVTDFGLAKQIDSTLDLTASGAIVGTPAYMAPEQAMGKYGDVTTRTDVYGLGALLYAMLMRRPPFQGATDQETIFMVASPEELRSPSVKRRTVLHDLWTICLKCLQKKSEERYESAQMIAEELQRCIDRVPLVTQPIGRAERMRRWCQKNPGVAGLSSAVMILGVAVIVSMAIGYVATEFQRQSAELSLFLAMNAPTEAIKLLANPEMAHDSSWVKSRDAAVLSVIEAYNTKTRQPVDGDQSLRDKIDFLIHTALCYTVIEDRNKACDVYRQAVEVAERAVEDRPGDAAFWGQVGQTHSHLGMEYWCEGRQAESKPHFARANDAFDRSTELNTKSIGITQHYAWFLNICPDSHFRDPELALGLANKLCELAKPKQKYNKQFQSGGIRPLFTLGLAQYRANVTGDKASLLIAQETLDESCKLRGGGDAYEFYVLAMVHAKLDKDYAAAREWYVKAVRWTIANRYSDFELHFLDNEATQLPALHGLDKSLPPIAKSSRK